jgi:hypothetical protein
MVAIPRHRATASLRRISNRLTGMHSKAAKALIPPWCQLGTTAMDVHQRAKTGRSAVIHVAVMRTVLPTVDKAKFMGRSMRVLDKWQAAPIPAHRLGGASFRPGS